MKKVVADKRKHWNLQKELCKEIIKSCFRFDEPEVINKKKKINKLHV